MGWHMGTCSQQRCWLHPRVSAQPRSSGLGLPVPWYPAGFAAGILSIVLLLSGQALVTIRLKADFLAEKAASGLELTIPFPKEAVRMSCEYEREPKPLGSQSWDWQERLHKLTWKLKRVQGGSDHTLKVQLSTSHLGAFAYAILHCNR